jgi:hypothetical protein
MACSKASRPKNPEAATVPATQQRAKAARSTPKCGVSEHPPPEEALLQVYRKTGIDLDQWFRLGGCIFCGLAQPGPYADVRLGAQGWSQRRLKAARPIRPTPSRTAVAGSGTAVIENEKSPFIVLDGPVPPILTPFFNPTV